MDRGRLARAAEGGVSRGIATGGGSAPAPRRASLPFSPA